MMPGMNRRPAPARPPEGTRIYAIGDVHGRLDLLDALLDTVRRDAARAAARGLTPIAVFLGDYIDRGPDSRGVLNLLARGPLPGVTCRYLRGNHEEYLQRFLDRDTVAVMPAWMTYGGIEMLASYGISAGDASDAAGCGMLRRLLARALPRPHKDFVDGLESLVVLGDYAFAHAGIKPGVPLTEQADADLLWIRGPFLTSAARHDKVVVHGHTSVAEPEVYANRIAVDTCAYASGVLTCAALEADGVEFLQARRPPSDDLANLDQEGADLSAQQLSLA